MSIAIQVENLSKSYRLGAIGGATLREDFSRWMAKLQRKPDPTLRIGQEHHARLMGKEFWALNDVTFQVKEGQILGIIGRNGAGKSTLLKILSRVTAPSSGRVKIRGRVASLLEVGTGFHPELTGKENVFLNGAILGMTKAEIRKKFDEIVAFSEVEEFIDTPVKRYSSGMYVRLAFAVAAHLEPEILIVDEVLAVGDMEFQRKCLAKMDDVSKGDGRTILFVSHNMSAVQTLAPQCVLFAEGRIKDQGESSAVIGNYLQNQSVGELVYDVENTPRPFPAMRRHLELIQLSFPKANGNFLRPGEDLLVSIRVRARTSLPSFRFSITIFRSDDSVVGTVFSPEECILASGETGDFSLCFRALPLAEGRYHMAIATGTGKSPQGNDEFDVVTHVLHFEVHDDSPNKIVWPHSWGAIRFTPPDVERRDNGLHS